MRIDHISVSTDAKSEEPMVGATDNPKLSAYDGTCACTPVAEATRQSA